MFIKLTAAGQIIVVRVGNISAIIEEPPYGEGKVSFNSVILDGGATIKTNEGIEEIRALIKRAQTDGGEMPC